MFSLVKTLFLIIKVKKKKQTREEKKGEEGSRILQRDTPFFDRLGFGGGTGRRGS